MYYLGICILIWLAAGFLTGIKMVYVDRGLTPEKVKALLAKAEGNDQQTQLILFATQKKNFIIIATLLGFIVFYTDFVETVKEGVQSFRKFKNRFKSKK